VLLALPDDGNRYEVVEGELPVSPAPSLPHQVVIAALARLLHPFVTAHGLGCVLHSPADIEFDERTLVQPDLFVAPLVQGHRPRSWKRSGSSCTPSRYCRLQRARADRQIKRRRYQRHGVGEY
jgi:hypothetical protein